MENEGEEKGLAQTLQLSHRAMNGVEIRRSYGSLHQ
jgi:hypothetical protein